MYYQGLLVGGRLLKMKTAGRALGVVTGRQVDLQIRFGHVPRPPNGLRNSTLLLPSYQALRRYKCVGALQHSHRFPVVLSTRQWPCTQRRMSGQRPRKPFKGLMGLLTHEIASKRYFLSFLGRFGGISLHLPSLSMKEIGRAHV